MEETIELRKEIEKLNRKLIKAEVALRDAEKGMEKLRKTVYELSDARAEALGLDKNIELRKIEDRLNNTHRKGKAPILQTNLSSRTANVLYRHGIKYIEDLSKTSKKELLAIRGIGESAVNEIVNYCKEYHIPFDK